MQIKRREEVKEFEDEFNEYWKTVPKDLRSEVKDALDDIIRRDMFGSDDDSELSCPYCPSLCFRRYGFNTSGKQRYRCCECGRCFVERKSGSIISNTKLPFETWSRFTECFVNDLSCKKTAEKIGVTPKTAWFMRIRAMEALKKNLPSFQVKAGCDAYVDGIYFNESFKGVSFKNLGKIPREPRHTGNCNIRGISNEKICVLTAVSDDGSFFYDVSCRGAMTKEICGNVLRNRICEGSIINTDNHKAYPEVLSKLKVQAHNAYDSKDHERLEPINRVHERIRSFFRSFRGVSTKWLDLYMAYFKWMWEFSRSSDKPESISSKQIFKGDYEHRWRSINRMKLPFRGADLSPQKI